MDLLKGNLIVLITFCLLVGCGSGGSQLRDRLGEIDLLADREPEQAIAALDSIKGMSMSDADRHYYDLLTIKAKDKAYVTHTSDSLILTTIDYYESHHDDRLTPMALYYGGRVYSDLGDYPTALHYFQRAIDMLDENCSDEVLFGKILSQTGRLLNNMRLFNQSMPYVEKAISINEKLQDTLGVVYDLQLLAAIQQRVKNFELAKKTVLRALQLDKNLNPHINIGNRVHLASIYNDMEMLDSALYYIRGTVDRSHTLSRDYALANACEIYMKAGVLDTAYMYAHELIYDPYFVNRKTGYEVLLSPKLRLIVNADSVQKYITDYRNNLEEYFNENQFHQVDMQQSLYNYQLHERQKLKAESERNRTYMWLAIAGLVIVGFVLLTLYMRMRNQNTLIRLRGALSNVVLLRQQLAMAQFGYQDDTAELSAISNMEDVQLLRERLRNELLKICNDGKKRMAIPSEILESDAYNEIQNLIVKEKPIGENSKLWDRLEEIIKKCSPNFETNLRLLTGGKLTKSEYQTAMLIKIGVTPSQMNTLLARSKGTISSRRESICVKVFDQKMGNKVIDDIIRLL